MNGEQAGATLEQLAKKYGYADAKSIWEYIEFYRNRDVLYSKFGDIPKCIPYAKARKVLRELKLSFFAEHFLR